MTADADTGRAARHAGPLPRPRPARPRAATRGATPSADVSRPRPGPEPELLYLTTTGRRTGLFREIEIWFTRRDGRFYLVAETGERAQWVRNLRADSRVRWRVGARVFTGRARVVNRVREVALAATVRTRSRAKYGWGDGLIVELRPRKAHRARG